MSTSLSSSTAGGGTEPTEGDVRWGEYRVVAGSDTRRAAAGAANAHTRQKKARVRLNSSHKGGRRFRGSKPLVASTTRAAPALGRKIAHPPCLATAAAAAVDLGVGAMGLGGRTRPEPAVDSRAVPPLLCPSPPRKEAVEAEVEMVTAAAPCPCWRALIASLWAFMACVGKGRTQACRQLQITAR